MDFPQFQMSRCLGSPIGRHSQRDLGTGFDGLVGNSVPFLSSCFVCSDLCCGGFSCVCCSWASS